MTHSNAIDKGQGHINIACILRPTFIMGFLSYLFAGGVDVLTSLTVTEAQYNNNQVELTLSDGRKVGKTENRFTCICRLISCIM